MYEFEEKQVELSKVKPCPVKVTFYTDKLFRDLVAIAKTHPEQIAPIAVASLGDSQYIVNGHLRVKAFESAGHDSARAYFIPVKEIADIVRLHIELNAHGSINPLKMLDAVQFLQRHHAVQSISKRYLELATKRLYPKVRIQWEEFLADACKKYTNVELPLHVIERIAEFESEKGQLTAITVITDSMKNVKDRKFVFPAPPELEIILVSISPKQSEKEVIVFQPKDSKKEKWPKLDKKEAEDLVHGSSHNSIVQCKCGNKLLLNTKTHAVSSVVDDAKNTCIKLEEEDQSKPVYAIPHGMIEFLQVKAEDSLRFLKIKSKRDLEKFAKSIKDDTSLHLVVISPK
jgi:hypothetical protein